jgi:pimeloyl-ACP methyl ester carboxylesterase
MITELAHTTHGHGDPPLLLVHGYTGSQLDWIDVIDPLAQDRRVITVDHRGHGESPNFDDESSYSLAILGEDFAAFVDRLELGCFDLLGHSMGGMIAMRYALAHPERIRSLILMDTAPGPIGGDNDFIVAGIALARAEGLDAVFAQIEGFMANIPNGGPIVERMRTKWSQLDVAAFCALGDELGAHDSVLDRLDELAMPTTVIVGEHDLPFRDPADAMMAKIPNATLEVIAGAAHSPQEEQPAAWLAAVRSHLARADTT